MKPRLGQAVLAAMLGAVDEGIHAVEVNGRTIFYNAAAVRIDGLSQAEVLNCHVLDVSPSLTPGTSTLLQVIRTGQPVTDQQQSFTNFKGQRVTTINTTLPLRLDGELLGALEISKDITRLQGLVERITSLQALVSPPAKKRPVEPSFTRYTLNDLVGNSDSMQEVKERVKRACKPADKHSVRGPDASPLLKGATLRTVQPGRQPFPPGPGSSLTKHSRCRSEQNCPATGSR